MARIDLTVEIPPLPEGFSGTPDELFTFFKENALFYIDGDAPAGQIGGARPTEDVGVFYDINGVETFRDGKYQPSSDVPIGTLLPWASGSTTPPANYLLADGRSILRADYAELFQVIGITWGTPESPTTFSLPDLRGRYPVGSGIGDYKYQGIIGRMRELIAGAYGGYEWVVRVTGFAPGAPITSMKTIAPHPATVNYLSVQSPAVAVPYIIRYR